VQAKARSTPKKSEKSAETPGPMKPKTASAPPARRFTDIKWANGRRELISYTPSQAETSDDPGDIFDENGNINPDWAEIPMTPREKQIQIYSGLDEKQWRDVSAQHYNSLWTMEDLQNHKSRNYMVRRFRQPYQRLMKAQVALDKAAIPVEAKWPSSVVLEKLKELKVLPQDAEGKIYHLATPAKVKSAYDRRVLDLIMILESPEGEKEQEAWTYAKNAMEAWAEIVNMQRHIYDRVIDLRRSINQRREDREDILDEASRRRSRRRRSRRIQQGDRRGWFQ